MDRLFDQVMGGLASPWGLPAAFTGPGVLSPRVDLAETDKGLEVTAELPGIDPKNVTIEIEAAEERQQRDLRESREGIWKCFSTAAARRGGGSGGGYDG
jgi:HSP20 family molecular chaperone IbpA